MSRWWIYLLVVRPTVTEYLEAGRGPRSARELITDIVLTIVLAVLAHVIRLQWDRLSHASETDSLTGAWNSRRLQRDLPREVERARRFGFPLTMAYLDLDRFKSINDRFGHTEGDRVLVLVAQALRRALREVDGCYRVGGDEFVLLLPGSDPEGGEALLTRIRSALDGDPVHLSRYGAGFSAGLAVLQEREQPEEFLRRADGLMYRMKGRDGRESRAAAEWSL